MGTLATLLLPRQCATCAKPATAPLCAGCERVAPWIVDPICLRCGAPAKGSRCSEEATHELTPQSMRAAARYAGGARDVLLAFKLLGERRAAAWLAQKMLRAAPAIPVDAAITFVPSDRRALAQRGFNPAEVLARHIGAGDARPLLDKIVRTPDLAGLTRNDRQAALQDAFAAKAGVKVPACVLLIDDVLTTGATVDACAVALTRAGARAVHVLTFARTLNR